MGTYKVLQDIEAEDKLVGPLTLKQFIFGAITLLLGFIIFKVGTAGALGIARWPLIIVFLIPTLIFGFLAAPIGRDQPNDIWLLARLRYYVVPHRRIWNQDGMSKLVTITAPKKVEKIYTNGLSQTEVKSRLEALANTLDSRGWAVKNVSVNLFAQPGYLSADGSSDRLVAASSLPQDTPMSDVSAADDIMDTKSNPTAQKLDSMMQASSNAIRQQAVNHAQPNNQQASAPPADYWFMANQPSGSAQVPADLSVFDSQVVAPGSEGSTHAPEPTDAEKAFIHEHEMDDTATKGWRNHMRTIQPLQQTKPSQAEQPKPSLDEPFSRPGSFEKHFDSSSFIANQTPQLVNSQPSTASPAYNPDTGAPVQTAATTAPTQQNTGTNTPNPAILGLANNDDLNVATIARQANKIAEATNNDGEVVISLH